MRIRQFILATSAVVAVVFFSAGYLAVGRVLEHSVRSNAIEASHTLTEVTFATMYEVMSTGWRRAQAERFLANVSDAAADSQTKLLIWRGDVVDREYGPLEQPLFDTDLRQVFADGQPLTIYGDQNVRNLRPLLAGERCFRCHELASEGEVLGVIDVQHDYSALLQTARRDFLAWLILVAPLLMALAVIAVWRVSSRIERSLVAVNESICEVNAVADLKDLQFDHHDPVLNEFETLFQNLTQLIQRLRAVAVDKDVLRFEVGLLERFLITSEVVRDWGDYISRLLKEINNVMPTHLLFSLFQIDDETFDLEVFWFSPPTAETRQMAESYISILVRHNLVGDYAQLNINHRAPQDGVPLSLDREVISVKTKTLMIDKPRIGGIVGIGVNSSTVEDETLQLVMDSILSTMLNVVGSVKAIHKYTQDMEYYATRDPLTDLFNRRVFWELLEYEIPRAIRHGYHFALLEIDLDNFKLINDNYGHAVGDIYLSAVANALTSRLRGGDILARYGGDEFVILLSETDLDSALLVATTMVQSVATVVVMSEDGKPICGTASVGVAIYPNHANNANDLFLFADSMMYKAKSAGRNQVGQPTENEVAEVFRDMTQTTMQVLEAVNERRIVPFFQPILDLKSERVVAYEVLSRLSLNGEHIPASRFIEFAEKAGVIHRLDIQVMEQALKRAAEIEFHGLIFLNLSPRALALAEFFQTLKRTVSECGFDPSQIVFEITERDTVKNISVLERLVSELKLEGFRIAIDDFGSGFSSFQYLRRLPVDFLKIEGDFVTTMLDNPRDHAFIETIWQLAHNLGIKVIAEHVENELVLQELMKMGIHMGQGYYIGRPDRELVNGFNYLPV
jgi:diguanylate cyclase (GGDEF)-like protein